MQYMHFHYTETFATDRLPFGKVLVVLNDFCRRHFYLFNVIVTLQKN